MANEAVTPALPSDAAALAAVESECPRAAGWGVKGFVSELAKPCALVLVAKDGDAVVGFICAEIIAPEAQILNVGVSARCRRHGLGSALLERLCLLARGRGCTSATLEVSEMNGPALAMYRKAGFEPAGRRAGFYGGAEDALLLDLRFAATGEDK